MGEVQVLPSAWCCKSVSRNNGVDVVGDEDVLVMLWEGVVRYDRFVNFWKYFRLWANLGLCVVRWCPR